MSIPLNKNQKIALQKNNKAAKKFLESMREFCNTWITLEETNSPIGFMDRMYPFKDKFHHEVYNVELWQQHINKVTTSIIADAKIMGE